MGKPWENHGKMVIYMENHPFLMGKPTISMVIFNSYVTNYQRVWLIMKCSYVVTLIPRNSIDFLDVSILRGLLPGYFASNVTLIGCFIFFQ